MRNIYLIIFIFLILIFGCRKTDSTSPPPSGPSKFTMKIGDTWWFERESKDTITTIDTIKFTVVKETTFNINDIAIPAYVIVDSASNEPAAYFHVSDSISYWSQLIIGTDTSLFLVRLIRANVKVGDTWEDVSEGGIVKIKSRVKAVDVNDSVPAGKFTVTKVIQDIYFDPWGYLGSFEWSINKDIIFVKDSAISPPVFCGFLKEGDFSIKVSKWYNKIGQSCDTTYITDRLIKFKRGS